MNNLEKPTTPGNKSPFIKTLLLSLGLIGGMANVTEAQTQQQVVGFLDRLKEKGVIENTVTPEEFQGYSAEKIQELTDTYIATIGAIRPDQAPANAEIIDRKIYTITLTEPGKEGNGETFDFEEWFGKQMERVRSGEIKSGESVLAPNGLLYKIELAPEGTYYPPELWESPQKVVEGTPGTTETKLMGERVKGE